MRSKKIFILCVQLVLCFLTQFCIQKQNSTAIKLLILTPENYFEKMISLEGTVKEIGPSNLWFVIEDKTGYIQVTTENVILSSNCLSRGKKMMIEGKLGEFERHKYFSLKKIKDCYE